MGAKRSRLPQAGLSGSSDLLFPSGRSDAQLDTMHVIVNSTCGYKQAKLSELDVWRSHPAIVACGCLGCRS